MIKGFSYGMGVVVVYATFALATLGFVAFAFSEKVELVADNYYSQEIRYQQRIDETSAGLEQPLEWKLSDDRKTLLLTFTEAAEANITLYRPSNSALDKTVQLSAQAGESASLPLDGLASGLWRVKIIWKTGGKSRYTEIPVHL